MSLFGRTRHIGPVYVGPRRFGIYSVACSRCMWSTAFLRRRDAVRLARWHVDFDCPRGSGS
jgi:hypothetical protein